MKKIRINELARELEVKAHEILDRLPELGVTEKKTHSSSIDEDVAIKLRRLYGHDVPEFEPEAESEAPEAVPSEPVHEAPTEAPRAAHEAPSAPAARTALEDTPAERPAPASAPAAASIPIRPPLSTGRPIHPPVGAARPAVPAQPTAAQTPPAAVIAPGRPTPPAAKPLPGPAAPTPRPGQILSGPRAPFPTAPAEGSRPGAPSALPQRPSVVPRRPEAVTQAPRETARTATQTPVGPPAPSRPLAGQPVARPVVPPRPDLKARLEQQRPAMPGAPTAPRPGIPKAPSAPVPGQPIYRGPIRPGQPLVQKPGMRTGAPGRPGGPRPQHPTSPRGPMGPGLAPPPMEQPRGRAGDRRPVRQQRERPEEEKILRGPARRREEQGPPPINREITISEGITVKELSEKLDVKANLVIKKLLDRGIFATINQTLEGKLATEVAREFGASTATVTYEEEAMQAVEEAEETKDLSKRAPVVTIMGHVDHGKTSLLDGIREANVAAREAGGITQHIGAYQVEMNGRKIVFIDTPGHEAFTRMRARGAKVTDIVILVVAADDGVMPQTLEAIDHAKAAKVPIIVAINKIDKPDAQPERIKQQLADRGLLAEDWGGDTVTVPVSAKTHQNLDLLLEMILLVADLQDLKANPGRPAMGTVIEAQLERGRAPVATVLVRNGTLA
ncbi:MAG TPA: translation initiation factor IF-2 N-terminal domain-containing protein, partial [Bryobacteraceae bacterium]